MKRLNKKEERKNGCYSPRTNSFFRWLCFPCPFLLTFKWPCWNISGPYTNHKLVPTSTVCILTFSVPCRFSLYLTYPQTVLNMIKWACWNPSRSYRNCSWFGLAVRLTHVRAGKQTDFGSNLLRLSFLFKSCGLWTLSCLTAHLNAEVILVVAV